MTEEIKPNETNLDYPKYFLLSIFVQYRLINPGLADEAARLFNLWSVILYKRRSN